MVVLPLMQRSGLALCRVSFVQEWLAWWREQSAFKRYLPLLIAMLYWLVLRALGGVHSNQWMMSFWFLALYYTGPRTQVYFRFALPLLITGVLYDSQRYFSHFVRSDVHVVEPYLIEQSIFGIPTDAGIRIPSEWFQTHTHWILDTIAGVAYLTYVAQYVFVAAYFVLFRKEKHKESYLLPWGFLVVNVLGFITYHLYAAAPPWYFSTYGFGPVPPEVFPNPAGAARFDDLYGVGAFAALYTQSRNVFGAIPSLHAAYPLLMVVFAFRFKSLRIFCSLFFLAVCFAAVYFNHHYVIDVLLGMLYALITAALLLGWDRFKCGRKSESTRRERAFRRAA